MRRDAFRFEMTFSPNGLKERVALLEKAASGLGDLRPPADAAEILQAFIGDGESLPPEEFASRWWGKKRALKILVMLLGVEPGAGEDLRRSERSSLLEYLSNVLRKRDASPLLPYLGFAAFQHPEDDSLWRLFLSRLRVYEGHRVFLVHWRNSAEYLRSPEKFARKIVTVRMPIEETLKEYELANTTLGNRICSRCCALVGGAIQELGEVYESELFGKYPKTNGDTRDWGILSRLPVNLLAPFVNEYCANLRSRPEKNNKVFHFLKEDVVLGNPWTSNRWLDESISARARKMMEQWILRKDFILAFDKILEHRERRDYWIKWLNAGKIDRIRIFSPEGDGIRKRLGIDHKVEELSMPTIFMRMGGCLAIECGVRGMGGLYVYPFGGPVAWDMKVNQPRDYKAPILDAFIVSPMSKRFMHYRNWEDKVSRYLKDVYHLQLPS